MSKYEVCLSFNPAGNRPDESTLTASETNDTSTSSQTQIDSIVFRVLQKFVQRADFGFKKYGTNLDRSDLSILDWIQHAQEEHMDAILYLEKLKQTYMESTPSVCHDPNSHSSKELDLSDVENLEKKKGFSSESKKTYEIYEGIHSILEGTYA